MRNRINILISQTTWIENQYNNINLKIKNMEKEIRNFELKHDGIIHISWNDGDTRHEWYINLSIYELLKMFELEGLSWKDFEDSWDKPIVFNKVILKYELCEGDLIEAWGFYEEFENNTLIKEKWGMELPLGHTLAMERKRCGNSTLMGSVWLDE